MGARRNFRLRKVVAASGMVGNRDAGSKRAEVERGISLGRREMTLWRVNDSYSTNATGRGKNLWVSRLLSFAPSGCVHPYIHLVVRDSTEERI